MRKPRIYALLLFASVATWSRADSYTAVSSRTSNDYQRTQTMDRKFVPETYAMGIGGDYSGAEAEKAGAAIVFRDVVNAVAGPLANQGYVPSKDPEKTQLLIMVYWGTTTGTGETVVGNPFKPVPYAFENKSGGAGSGAGIVQENQHRTTGGFDFEDDNADAVGLFNRGVSDARNAALLGYDSGLNVPAGSEITALHVTRDDLIEDIRHNRYFVVLMAYDFQKLWKEKKRKLVWETRYSVRQDETDFARMLPPMSQYASQYFGKDTFGLLRRPLPDAEVEVGEPRFVAVQENEAPSQVATLISKPFAEDTESSKGMRSSVPPDLASRIDAYKRDRAQLMRDLAAQMKPGESGEESRNSVEAFNAANSQRIAMLSSTARGIRVELAQIAATSEPTDGGRNLTTLEKQFNAEVRQMDVTEPILTHP